MKAFFAVLCVSALAALCAAEDGLFNVTLTSMCDTVQEGLIISNEGEVRATKKTHGTFSITTASDGTELVRPDIVFLGEGEASFLEHSDGTCETYSTLPQDPLIFEHREETTYNGHKCFRYFNNSALSVWVDKNNIIWGKYSLSNGMQTWNNYSYPKEPHTPSMFMFNETSACGQYSKTLEAPNETFFYDMCMNDSASHLLGSLFLMVATVLLSLLF